MREVTIDMILRDHYNAISSDKLSDDNIKIDTDMVIEDSKNKYLVAFAEFLNNASLNGYKISESIMSKLLNIIEYEGYQYQIINEYIRILKENMNWTLEEENIKLKPKQAIEYINFYLSTDPNTTAYYITTYKFETVIGYPLLIEVDDPTKLINDDFKLWIGAYRKLCDISYYYYKNHYNLYYAALRGHRDRILMALPLLEEDDIEKLDVLIQQYYDMSDLATLLEMYYRYNKVDYLTDPLPEVVNRNIRRLIELKMVNVAPEQLALEISDDIDLWEGFNFNNADLGINTLQSAIDIYNTWPDRYNIDDSASLISKIVHKYPDDVYFYARQILLDMNYKEFCDKFTYIIAELDNKISEEERDSLVSECINGLILLRNEEVNNEIENLYKRLNTIYTSGNINSRFIYPSICILEDNMGNIR